MKDYSDMIGQRFGQWTVIGLSDRPRYVFCRCSCGCERDVYVASLRNGRSTRCSKHVNRAAITAANLARSEKILERSRELIGQSVNGFLIKSVYRKRYNGSNCTFCIARCPVCGQDTETLLSRIRRGMKRCAKCNRDLGKKLDCVTEAYFVDGTCLHLLQSRLSGTVNKNSSTGVNGVSRVKDGRYRAYINFRRKQYHLGVYDRLEDAVDARKKAETLFQDFLDENDGWENRYAELAKLIKEESK